MPMYTIGVEMPTLVSLCRLHAAPARSMTRIHSVYQKSRTLPNVKRAALNGPPNRSSVKSEGETALELNQPWRSISTQERPQNAGWSVNRADDRAKIWVGNVADRLVEVGMVEKVEELCSNADPCSFPVRDLEILHYGEIGVEVFRAVELIASLDPKAIAGRQEHGGCETWFGDCTGTTG